MRTYADHSQGFENEVFKEMLDNMPPKAKNQVGPHQFHSFLNQIGHISKESAQLLEANITYFFPVFFMPGLRSADLKNAKASSIGLLA